ncbi:hypothetical protein DFH09DRAFT_1319340 [Mycena vulgaris]|nr:hypothetical protein DFH09DRAFT_1319340 [Mycena vulgaris]
MFLKRNKWRTHYNTADRLRFEQYAEALQAAGAGLGPFPGLPPPGYRESFRLSQRFAPVPEDYPCLFGTPEQHVAVPSSASADVAMSTAAFSTTSSNPCYATEDISLGSKGQRDWNFKFSSPASSSALLNMPLVVNLRLTPRGLAANYIFVARNRCEDLHLPNYPS